MAREKALEPPLIAPFQAMPCSAITARLRRRVAKPGSSQRGWRAASGLCPACVHIPRVAGCYAIYVGGCLAYVGSAQSIYHRFHAYHIRYTYGNEILTPWGVTGESVELKYKPSRRYGDWAMAELRLIRRLKPPLNQKCLTGKPAPNKLWSNNKAVA